MHKALAMQPSEELPNGPEDGSLFRQSTEGARRGTRLHGSPASPAPAISSPSINDLIEEHQRPGRTHYAEVKAAYEMGNGKIVENYFGRFVHAGALLIENSGSRWIGRLRRRRSRIALAYDSSKAVPALDEALRTVRIEERQSAVLLSGRAAQILTQTAYLLIVFLLSALDRPDPQSLDATATEQRLSRISWKLRWRSPA
jgi:hypothetical protein